MQIICCGKEMEFVVAVSINGTKQYICKGCNSLVEVRIVRESK